MWPRGRSLLSTIGLFAVVVFYRVTVYIFCIAHQSGVHGGEASGGVPCPRRGVHHTSPSDGCIHRLTVGCHAQHVINIDHSCSAPSQRGTTNSHDPLIPFVVRDWALSTFYFRFPNIGYVFLHLLK